jgi:hypothetical protein
MRALLPQYGIAFETIARREFDGNVISASRVRAALERREWDTIAELVPETTYRYLRERFELKHRTYFNVVYVPSQNNGNTLGLYDEKKRYIAYTGKRKFGTSTYSSQDEPLSELPLASSVMYSRDYGNKDIIWFGYLRRHYGHFMIVVRICRNFIMIAYVLLE